MLDALIAQVRVNARISDATHWGYYSTCGLLMRLRSLYRFEHGIAPWERADESRIAGWVGGIEARWPELEDTPMARIEIMGRAYDPLDSEGINAALGPLGLYYGMGYGLYMKPVIFLAELSERREIDGRQVVIAGREYVRDISTHPAMHQAGTIIIRSELAEAYIWEQYAEACSRDRCSLLAKAFESYGVGEGAGPPDLAPVVGSEMEVMIRHELGESIEGQRLGDEWLGMLAELGHGRAALGLRAIKDVASDMADKGPLAYIIEGGRPGAMGFFAASFGGLRDMLCPNLREAYREFIRDVEWERMGRARLECYRKAAGAADELLGLYLAHGATPEFAARVESYFSREV